MGQEKVRCGWAAKADGLMRRYHDEEWGYPQHHGASLWENLSLQGFQAGLSWELILRKREALRYAFQGFQPRRVAAFDENTVERLLLDTTIIRSRRKIEAVIANANSM